MLFGEKNDGGIELHLSSEERKLIYEALRHYSAYGKNEKVIVDEIPLICEIMNVLFVEQGVMVGGSSTGNRCENSRVE